MKKIFILVIFLVYGLLAQDKQQIIRSGAYYYGSGLSFDVGEARDRALAELTGQIAVRVANSFERKIVESDKGLDDQVKSILHTHSAATLKNVTTLKKPQADGRIEVFCYLPKSEVTKVFNERKRLIYDMYREALQDEATGNYASALKLYYFSLLLMNSLPDEKIVYQDINFTIDIPGRINRIIADIRFFLIGDKQISTKEREITLKIERAGSPVSNLDFTFFDGSNQVLVQGRDGLATFKLLGASTKFNELTLAIKYAYYEARDEYNVIAELWPIVLKPTFNAIKTISLKKKRQTTVSAQTQAAANWNIQLTFKGQIPLAQKITESTIRFLNVIAKGGKAQIRQTYADDPFLRDKLLNYVTFNHPQPLAKKVQADLNKTKNGYELRKICMLHTYPSLHKQSTEYLVLDFDDKGQLIDLNASITENLYQTFVQQSEFSGDWDKRQQIIKFIEKYRMAYLTRDINTIDLMFAEDALILVGRKIKRKKLPDSMDKYYRKFRNEPDYSYIKLTKQKYLKRQRQVFNAQKDIFLDFSSFDIVKKNSSKNVYGVEMRQSYHSTTYSDEGYLFLLIDFNKRDPMIYVRAWQPNEWSDSSKIRTANFLIHK